MTILLVISFQFPYVHHYPGCDIVGKEYLRHPHRHLMKCRAWLRVTRQDREVEFIALKEEVESWAREHFTVDSLTASPATSPMSCEQMAAALMRRFDFSRVEVLEDGENGADITMEVKRRAKPTD